MLLISKDFLVVSLTLLVSDEKNFYLHSINSQLKILFSQCFEKKKMTTSKKEFMMKIMREKEVILS